MKKTLRMFVIVMVVMLSMCIMPVTNASAAKKVKLNKTKATIYVGKTVNLKLKNNKKKVKWSSSKKKVATVSKKGKVKGKKAGKTTITAKVGKKKYKCKVTVKAKKQNNRKATENRDEQNKKNYYVNKIDTIDTYINNFDSIVEYVKKNGEFSTYGAYCTYGYVSVSMDGNDISFFEGYDRGGHMVTIHRGSYTAEARVNLRIGFAHASFDIRYFKGDASDSLNWDNEPTIEQAFSYDAAIANVLKNVSKYDFYMGDYSFKEIGFESYLF